MEYILLPFAKLLQFFYTVTGSYGLALIMFCFVFRIILYPISLKGRKSMMDMSGLAEEQKRLQQKYARDRQRYSEELAALYERENVKPSGGCLWSFLPMPIMIALYGIVRKPLTHLMGLNSDQINALSDYLMGSVLTTGNAEITLAQPLYERFDEVVAHFPELAGQIYPVDFTFLGIDLSQIPNIFFFRQENWMTWGVIGLVLIPVISAILSYVSMKVTNRTTKRVMGTTTDPSAADPQNKMMGVMMPLMSLWICFTVPASLGVYWTASSVFAIGQEFVSVGLLKKYVVKKKEAAAQRAEEQKQREKEQKKLAAEQRQKAQEEAKRIKLERKLNNSVVTESRVGIRAYARGRTYDPDRYPVTQYTDPDLLAEEHRKAMAEAAEKAARDKEAGIKPEKKKKKRGLQVEPVIEPVIPERTSEIDDGKKTENTES